MALFTDKLKFFLFLPAFYLPVKLKAQKQTLPPFADSSALFPKSVSRICSNDMILYHLRKDPAFRTKENKMNSDILRMLRPVSNDTIILPVVVHIINTNPSSITDLQVINGIDLLNAAYSKSGFYSSSLGVDTKIRFCLSKKDPDGGNSTGITRTTSFFSTHLNMDIEDGRLKNLVQWDPSRYINIWLVTNIEGEANASFTCGTWSRLNVAGYATMPPGIPSLDGIVVTTFGSLLAHEMGHYLGLYHTFEGGCLNNDCLINGDRVCDTPPDGSVAPSAGCNSPDNTCNSDTLSNYSNGFFHTDVPDQVANFMDYGNGACSNEFTQGQADRMTAAIMTQRSGLLQDECTQPCIENIIAGFTRDIAYPLPGDQITFTNTSSGASNYQWLVDDAVVAITPDFSHIFNAIGKYKVTLKAFNTITCFASYTDYIIVTCGVTARFYADKKTIASKIPIYTDNILFTNTSYNARSYQWLISSDQGMAEQVVSTSTDLRYVFPTPANYRVRLVATNGSCSDTTEAYTVPVLDPAPDGVPFNVVLSCYPPNKVRVRFCIANYGYAPIPLNTPVNFYDADPRLPGANKLLPAYYLSDIVPGSCSRCFTNILDVDYHGLDKIYIAFNDTGNSVPVVLPNTYVLEKSYTNNFGNSQPTKTTVNAAICQGQDYAGHTRAGTYIDTLTSIINGCDSIRTLHLTVKPTIRSNIAATICQDDNYAGHTSSGSYIDVYTAVNGCDSTRTLQLTVKPKSFSTLNVSICPGESYLAGGHLQTVTGAYTDTSVNYLGCDSIITTNLTVNAAFPDLGEDRGICFGEMLTLSPGSFVSYLWQDGSTNRTYTTNIPGQYSVLVSNNFGCKASDTIQVPEIYPLPLVSLPADTSLCRGNVVHVSMPGYSSYLWSTGSDKSFIDVKKPGTYRLIAADKNGCKGSDSMKISYYNCAAVWIPNAFTPDADGLNEKFRPIFPAPVLNYHMQIWNRWGLLVFETTNTSAGWDGKFKSKPQPVAVYVYVIIFQDIDGVYETKSGTVTLLR